MDQLNRDRPVSLRHPRRIALCALAALAISYLVAAQDSPPAWELTLTEQINSVDDLVAYALWPVMQMGTVFGPLIAAAALLIWRRDLRLAIVTAVTGVLAWFAAKFVKAIVERGRPLQYLPGIEVREGSGGGLGYISGHSTVAASIAILVAAAMPSRWRWLAALGAALVGVGRVVYGMHLPADVVGGWAFGTLFGLGGLWVYQQWNGRRITRG
jgi:glycosyltransferase 2 family protein